MNEIQDIKLVCFDMDNTLIKENSWYRVNLALGITKEEDEEMYHAYGSGEISYEEWNNALNALYAERGLATRDTVERLLTEFSFKDDAVELVQYLKSKGYEIAIITGSFEQLAAQVAEELGITHVRANSHVVFNDDGSFRSVETKGDVVEGKQKDLEDLLSELGVEAGECLCVGDGASDIGLFRVARFGITFNDAPQTLKDASWKIVDSLREIISIL